METKPLLFGLIGFFIGGLLVSVAATTFDRPDHSGAVMTAMADNLQGKTGDEFDRAFLSDMIVHHEGAVAMARQAADNAKHDEIKRLSDDIVRTQQAEISRMQAWQADWGYKTPGHTSDDHR